MDVSHRLKSLCIFSPETSGALLKLEPVTPPPYLIGNNGTPPQCSDWDDIIDWSIGEVGVHCQYTTRTVYCARISIDKSWSSRIFIIDRPCINGARGNWPLYCILMCLYFMRSSSVIIKLLFSTVCPKYLLFIWWHSLRIYMCLCVFVCVGRCTGKWKPRHIFLTALQLC